MCARISRVFLPVMVAALCVLWGCGQTTDPKEEVVVTPACISHLSIGPMEVEALLEVDDPARIAKVLALLSEEEWTVLERREVLHVGDTKVARDIARRIGLDTSVPGTPAGGVLLSSVRMTWGQLKCCYAGNVQCCPTKKKDQ